MRETKARRTIRELNKFLEKTGFTVEESQFSPHRINIRHPDGTVKTSNMRLMPRKATKRAYAIHARHWGSAQVTKRENE